MFYGVGVVRNIVTVRIPYVTGAFGTFRFLYTRNVGTFDTPEFGRYKRRVNE